MKVFDRAIFGASAFCCGMNLSKKDVVVEKNIFCAVEFCQSFNINKVNSNGEFLTEELKKRNILGNDGFYSPLPVSAFLAKILKQKNTNVLFDCKVTSVEKKDNGFLIEYFSQSGFNKIFAKEIVDTTSLGVFSQLREYTNKHYIAALDGFCGKTGDFEIMKGHLKNEYFLKISAENLDYISARKRLLEISEKNNFVIASFASEFSFSYNEKFLKKDNNYSFVPSASFANFAEAFKAGGEWQ